MISPLPIEAVSAWLTDLTTEDRVRHKAWEFRVDDQGKRVGRLSFDRQTGEVLHLFVDPDYRRCGIATALFRMAQALGAVQSHQRTDDGQAWALSLGEPLPTWDRI